jgi:hypothetical protein
MPTSIVGASRIFRRQMVSLRKIGQSNAPPVRRKNHPAPILKFKVFLDRTLAYERLDDVASKSILTGPDPHIEVRVESIICSERRAGICQLRFINWFR